MKTKHTLIIILFLSFLTNDLMAQSSLFQPSNGQTYLIESKIKQRGVKNSTQLNNLTSRQLEREITYFDDAERPIQIIGWQSSPEYRDFVIPKLYDVHSREALQFEPYPDITYNGEYHTTNSSYNNQEEFYTNPPDGIVKMPSQMAVSRTLFETGPGGRPIDQGAPGAEWNIGYGHSVRREYSTNSTSEIPLWVINDDGNGAELKGYYPANSLYKTTAIDENGKKRIEYKDKQGKIVCKSVQNSSSSYVSTYYIFDNIGNLRYVIPPIPSEYGSVPSSFNENSTIFNSLVFGYRYRGGNQIIEKKTPGKGWQTLIYNKLDQPILVQDAELKKTGRWIYTKYDALGRPIITGIYTDNIHVGQANMQQYVNNLNISNWEKFDNSLLNGGYTNVSFPVEFISVQEINYYDTYDALNNNAINNVPDLFTTPSIGVDTLQRYPRGLLVAKKTKILNTAVFLFTVNYYNTDGNVVKTISQNFRNGQSNAADFDVNEYQYTFDGMVSQVLRKHHNINVTTPALTIQNNYSYDHRGRPLKNLVKYNSQAAIVLAQYEYNAIGQLKTKHIHNTNAAINAPVSGYLQHIDYRYNERGWLTRINNPDNLTDENNGNQADAFALFLFYNTNNPATGITGAPQYNSNISSVSWTSQRANGILVKRSFRYSYDDLNRMTLARYNTQSESSTYDENLSYDDLGNIKTLERKKAGIVLNNLNYSYGNGTNFSHRLNAVNDSGTENISSTYIYNENGSLIGDSKKGISEIIYNYLNLPDKIVFNSGKELRYIYDATGLKLSRQIWQGGNLVDTRSYINGLEYNGNAIEFISNDEGRTIPSSGNYILEYALNDHLGNCRVLIGDKNNNGTLESTEILQNTDYYAFGRTINYGANVVPSPDNAYKYNGKEFQSDLEQYDYGARFYDPVIARWNVIDPMGDESVSNSPYNYVYNNPLGFTDPSGMIAQGWILGADRVTITYDPNVHDQGDVTNGGTYLGEHGYSINPITGNTIFHRGDGTIISGVQGLSEINITAKGRSIGAQVLDGAIGFTPVVGSVRDIYQGARDGNYLQMTIGAIGLAADISSFGTSSFLRGGLKTIGKELAEEIVKSESKQLLLEAPKLAKHHVFSQQFREWFVQRGINNIDDYTVQVARKSHLTAIHGNGVGFSPGKWNDIWKTFKSANPQATPSQIFHQGESMLKDFGLEHLPYLPYK